MERALAGRLDLAPDNWRCVGDGCGLTSAGACNLLGRDRCCVAAGFEPAGERDCAWRDDGAPFRVQFHSFAEPVEAVVTRGSPDPCGDPGCAGVALVGPDDRILVRGIVRCSECDSPYVRVRIAKTSNDYWYWLLVDAVVDREFTTRFEAGTAVSFEATEVFGARTGRLDCIEVREGMDAVEIRIEGGREASSSQRSAAWAPAANFGPVGTEELETDLTNHPRFLGWGDGRLLVVAGDDSFVRSYCMGHDATNPLVLGPEGQFAIHHAPFSENGVVAGDALLHLSKDGILVAAALPSLQVLWQQQPDLSGSILAGAVRRSSDVVLLIAPSTCCDDEEYPDEDELLGLAWSDGNTVWRRSAASGSTLLAADGRAVLLDRQGRVEGLQEGSGEVAWTAETGLSVGPGLAHRHGSVVVWIAEAGLHVGDEGFQLAGPHHVVVGKPGARLVVLDADTGAKLSSMRLPGDETFVPLAVLDDVLLATTSWQDREGWQVHEVRAIDLATAGVRWKSGRSLTRGSDWPFEPVGLVGIDDDVIYVYTPDDMLRVLDRATGEELASWRQAPEGCLVEPVLVRPVSTEPAMVLCLNRPTTLESARCPMYLRPLPAVVTVLARVAEPPSPGWPVEEATIAGQVTWRGRPAGARVRVTTSAFERTTKAGSR